MDKEINGHLYILNDNIVRIADALEEILRLVKKDQEKMEHINLKEKYASLEPDLNDEEIEEEARLKDGDDEVSWSK